MAGWGWRWQLLAGIHRCFQHARLWVEVPFMTANEIAEELILDQLPLGVRNPFLVAQIADELGNQAGQVLRRWIRQLLVFLYFVPPLVSTILVYGLQDEIAQRPGRSGAPREIAHVLGQPVEVRIRDEVLDAVEQRTVVGIGRRRVFEVAVNLVVRSPLPEIRDGPLKDVGGGLHGGPGN